jgi:hypothetical protein
MKELTKESIRDFETQINKIINNGKLEGMEKADSFFLQQILVRRFKLKSRDKFDALVSIREGIEKLMASTPLPYFSPAASPLDPTYLVYAVMSLLFKQSQCSEYVTTDFVKQELATYILSRHAISFNIVISEKLLDLVIEYLEYIQSDFDLIVNSLTYFDFYSPLEMSLEVDFEELLKIYHTAFYDIEKFISLNFHSMFQANEIKWFFGYESSCKELEYFYQLGFPQYKGNVDIIVNKGDNSEHDNEVVINGDRTSNALYIKIPLDQLPKMLDRKIEKVKYLLNTHYSNSTFGVSKLNQRDTCCLLKESRSISKVIYSLACWDVAKKTPKRTVNFAIQSLSNEIDIINNILNDNQINKAVCAYHEDSAKKYYDWMASLIKGKGSKVDTFLTGNETGQIGIKTSYL